MNLSDLTDYAKEKYNIAEEYNRASNGVSSVLCHPDTGKCFAVLYRHWDMETGSEIQLCDLKCNGQYLAEIDGEYISKPFCMNSKNWIGIRFIDSTDPDLVFRLFDLAIESGRQSPYTITISSKPRSEIFQNNGARYYSETLLPFADSSYRSTRILIPKRIKQMRQMYEYGKESYSAKAKNFYRQGMFMQDYIDSIPWTEEFNCYYPTYHDMSVTQLRGYFSWRSKVRNGVLEQISSSAVYVYLYELLNEIGCTSPEDSFQKMIAFRKRYLDSRFADHRVISNLNTWMKEFAVLHSLPKETVREILDPEIVQRDHAIEVLRNPKEYSDEVFNSLLQFGSNTVLKSPVLKEHPENGVYMFGVLWQLVSDAFHRDGKDLFEECFGKAVTSFWRPLSNAVYYNRSNVESSDYSLTEAHSFQCRNGVWKQTVFEKRNIHSERINSFLRAADAQLRIWYNTGKNLKLRPADSWLVPYMEEAAKMLHQSERKAAILSVKIDLSGLDRIRQDAETTQNQLLTDDERLEMTEQEIIQNAGEKADDVPFDHTVVSILRMLLSDHDPSEFVRQNHLTSSLAADLINDALMDILGDTAVSCDDDRLMIVEDYRKDLMSILGGT